MNVPPYDVAVYGATGFTGKLIAQYLATHPEAPRLVLAGRNPEKLQATLEQLHGLSKERLKTITLVQATVDNKQSLSHLARAAKVLINAAGPYTLYGGFDIAQAVAEAGNAYLDLTGETNLYARMVEKIHPIAKETNAIIVPSAGFDSLPFDLATFLAVEEVKKVAGVESAVSKVLLGFRLRASVSGGTVQSGLIACDEDPTSLRNNRPYWFSPVKGTQERASTMPRYMPQFGKYGTEIMLSPHNTRIVNRTWGLLEESHVPIRYGPNFRYEEGLVVPSYILALFLTMFVHVFAFIMEHASFVVRIMSRMVPPGSGPTIENQLKGFLELCALAYGQDGRTKGLATFYTKGDPGYLKTAAFISEAGLAIALNPELLSPLAQQGGVLTPAILGTEILRERLSKFAGVSIHAADVTNAENPAKVFARG